VRRDILPDEDLSPLFEGIMKLVRDRSSIAQTTIGAMLLPDFWTENVEVGEDENYSDDLADETIPRDSPDNQSPKKPEEGEKAEGDFSKFPKVEIEDLSGQVSRLEIQEMSESSHMMKEREAGLKALQPDSSKTETENQVSLPNQKTLIIAQASRRDYSDLMLAVTTGVDEFERRGCFNNERTVVLTELMDEPNMFKEGQMWDGSVEGLHGGARLIISFEPSSEGVREEELNLAQFIKAGFEKIVGQKASQMKHDSSKGLQELIVQIHRRANSISWGDNVDTEGEPSRSERPSGKGEEMSKGQPMEKDLPEEPEDLHHQMTMARLSNQLKGRRYTADLEQLSTPQLEKLSQCLHDDESERFPIPKQDLFAMHREVDIVLFERRSNLSGDNLIRDSYLLTRKFQEFLKKDTGINTVLETIESHLSLLAGSSRDMLLCRLLFVQVLSRAYEMRGTKEYRQKNVDYLRQSLQDHERLQKLNICIDGEQSNGSATMYSATAELYARALQFPIVYDIEDPADQLTAAQEAIDFLAQWAEKDLEAGFEGKAAWKLVMEAGFRMKFLDGTDINVVKTIGPLLDKAEACSATLEPRDKEQFDEELKQGREAHRVLLAINTEVYSQDETGSRPPGTWDERHRQRYCC